MHVPLQLHINGAIKFPLFIQLVKVVKLYNFTQKCLASHFLTLKSTLKQPHYLCLRGFIFETEITSIRFGPI